jgi:hypothetical protein
MWRPSSAQNLQLLRFLKKNHSINDKGFIEMLKEAGVNETTKTIRTKLANWSNLTMKNNDCCKNSCMLFPDDDHLQYNEGTANSNALGLKILERNDSRISVINCSALVKPVGIVVSGESKMIVDHEEIYN